MMGIIYLFLSALCIGLGSSTKLLTIDLDSTVRNFANQGLIEDEFVFVYAMTVVPSHETTHKEKWLKSAYYQNGLRHCGDRCDSTMTIGQCAHIVSPHLISLLIQSHRHTVSELEDIKTRIRKAVDNKVGTKIIVLRIVGSVVGFIAFVFIIRWCLNRRKTTTTTTTTIPVMMYTQAPPPATTMTAPVYYTQQPHGTGFPPATTMNAPVYYTQQPHGTVPVLVATAV